MSESLRDLLVRHAHELADYLAAQTQAPSKAPPTKRRARGPVIVKPAPMEMTPEQRDIAERYARRALGR